MRILDLTLFTNDILSQKEFFTKKLNLKIEALSKDEINIQIGWTNLKFIKSDIPYLYHYCFLIPENKMEEAIAWLENKVDILKVDKKEPVQYFETWNAHSIYFYDGVGNLVEFIARHNLKNGSKEKFSASHILCVNEIGMPTNKIELLNQQLTEEAGSKFWKGNTDRFGTNGDEEGLLLLVNNEEKKNWFPTTLFPEASPFEILIKTEIKETRFDYKNMKINFKN